MTLPVPWDPKKEVAQIHVEQTTVEGTDKPTNNTSSFLPGYQVTLSAIIQADSSPFYHWAMITRPDGSSSMLDTSSSANCSFTPDLKGTYAVELTRSRGVRQVAYVRVAALYGIERAQIAIDQDDGPGAGVPGQSRTDLWKGVEVTLSATTSGSSSYSWTLTRVPAGSTAVLDTPSESECHFTPNVNGTYGIQLMRGSGVSQNLTARVADALPCNYCNKILGLTTQRIRIPGMGGLGYSTGFVCDGVAIKSIGIYLSALLPYLNIAKCLLLIYEAAKALIPTSGIVPEFAKCLAKLNEFASTCPVQLSPLIYLNTLYDILSLVIAFLECIQDMLTLHTAVNDEIAAMTATVDASLKYQAACLSLQNDANMQEINLKLSSLEVILEVVKIILSLAGQQDAADKIDPSSTSASPQVIEDLIAILTPIRDMIPHS